MNINSDSLPSNRHFGFLFAGLFALLTAYSAYRDAAAVTVYGWLMASILVGIVSIVAPKLLMPFNKAWMKLGELMSNVVSPLVLGIIFFVLITPVALATRLFGRDELRLKENASLNSFWINRAPPGPTGESFKNQF